MGPHTTKMSASRGKQPPAASCAGTAGFVELHSVF